MIHMGRRWIGGAGAAAAFLLGAGVVLAVATAGDVSVTVDEDAVGATITLTGTTDSGASTVTFDITNGGPTQGTLDVATGTLDCVAGDCTGDVHYSPAADDNGSDSFTYSVTDIDGPSGDGTVTITVTAVNDVPSFAAGLDQLVLEDAGLTSAAGWATGISAGPSDESGQALDFQLSSDSNPGLFSVAPAVNAATGSLTFTPAPNASGSATVGFRLHDDGGTANNGVDLSPEQTFTITVTAVNDAPSFTPGANPTVNWNSGAFSASGWATAMSPGPSDESGQQVSFAFTANDSPSLFSAGPSVAADGTLSFTPAANQTGTAHLTLVCQDDGGTADGGQDSSPASSVTIRVNAPPNAVNDTTFVVPENSSGTTLNVLANDTSLPDTSETLLITAVTSPVHGSVTITGGGTTVRYTPTPMYYGDLADFFTYTISDGLDTDTATVILSIARDTTPPTVTGAAPRIRTGVTMNGKSVLGRVTWSGSDAGVGIDHYTIQRSVNGGAYSTLGNPTAASFDVTYTIGSSTYRYRVRAVDRNNNTGAWSYSPTVGDARSQETSGNIKYGGAWSKSSHSSYSGGATRYASTAGRSATFTRTFRDVAFVAPKSSSRGSADIYVDGVKVATISLKQASTQYRQVVWTTHFSTLASHSIKVVVVGNGRVDVDCFVVLL